MWGNINEEVKGCIEKVGFKKPTDIQKKVVPLLLKGKNVIAVSATGSGKTHAFLIPIINNIIDRDKCNAIIISPTRELAMQTFQKLKEFQPEWCKSKLIIGGEDINKQIEQLKGNTNIIVATPGRLVELDKLGYSSMFNSKTIVVDECDTVFSLGFFDSVDYIIAKANKDVQICLCSATLPDEVKNFVTKYMEKPEKVIIDKMDWISKNVENFAYFTKNKDRMDTLVNLVENTNPYVMIIFANKKRDVASIAMKLRTLGKKVIEIHGDLQQRERKVNMKKISSNEYKYIVASDIAARGMDIDGISHVVHYDVPLHDIEMFVHRSGRTGRGQYTGYNYVIYDSEELSILNKLEQKGFKYTFLEYKNNEWVKKTERKSVKKQEETKLDRDITRIINTSKKQQVKPGYKKKRKEAINKAKGRYKREIIKKDIKRQQKEKSIKHQRLIKGGK